MKKLIALSVLLASASFLSSCKTTTGGSDEYTEYADNPYPGQAGYQPYTEGGGQAPEYQQYTPPQESYVPETSYTPEPAPTYTAPKPKPSTSKPSKPKTTSSSRTYTVQKGDTLYRISRNQGASVSQIKSANGLTSDLIVPGQKLVIP